MWSKLAWAFSSRKVLVALVSLVVAIAAEMGLSLNGEALLSVAVLGASVIYGIAKEDSARMQGGKNGPSN